jgi:hypothetical protein
MAAAADPSDSKMDSTQPWASLRSLAAAALTLASSQCGGGSETGNAGGGGDLSCADAPTTGVVKLQGTIGGQAVSVDQSPASGAFSQLTTGQLDIPMNITIGDASIGVTPADVQIHLTWSGLVSDGSSASASGTVTLPEGQPLGQMTLCAGNGSTISPNHPGAAFVLAGLALSPGCTQPIEGELRGCWGWGWAH